MVKKWPSNSAKKASGFLMRKLGFSHLAISFSFYVSGIYTCLHQGEQKVWLKTNSPSLNWWYIPAVKRYPLREYENGWPCMYLVIASSMPVSAQEMHHAGHNAVGRTRLKKHSRHLITKMKVCLASASPTASSSLMCKTLSHRYGQVSLRVPT